jgi:hypothetical protein
MNCQALRDAMLDIARGQPVGKGSAAALEAHVQYCPSCAAFLDRQRELSAGLRALAASTDARVAPEMERRLLIAFAEKHARRSIASRVLRARWVPAAAMVVLVVGAIALWRTSSGPVSPARGIPVAPTEPRKVIIAEGFMPLPIAAGLPDFESGEIVRVEIPVASLPSYGIELVPEVKRTPVQADLLVGQDGQARAIRLVRDANVDRGVTP